MVSSIGIRCYIRFVPTYIHINHIYLYLYIIYYYIRLIKKYMTQWIILGGHPACRNKSFPVPISSYFHGSLFRNILPPRSPPTSTTTPKLRRCSGYKDNKQPPVFFSRPALNNKLLTFGWLCAYRGWRCSVQMKVWWMGYLPPMAIRTQRRAKGPRVRERFIPPGSDHTIIILFIRIPIQRWAKEIFILFNITITLCTFLFPKWWLYK